MNEQVEQALKVWYENMVSGPGLYDSLREIGEVDAIGPQERLQEMFLKRLNGFGIQLAVTYTEEFGNVRVGDASSEIEFDMATLRANGMTSSLPFTSDRGVKGTVRLDWQHATLVFIPEDGEPSIYVVNEFLESAMIWGIGHKLSIRLLCVIAPLVDAESREVDFLSDVSLNKFYIEGLIFADRSKLGKDGYFNPQAGVTFKDVSAVTGVPASTLSNIRNGKKSLENLTWTTLAALSFYAQIRMLDSHIIDMLRRQLSGDAPGAAVESESTDQSMRYGQAYETRCVVVALRDGASYQLENNGREPVDDLYESVMAAYADDSTAMDLKFTVNEIGEKLYRLMVPKSDVKHIRIERCKPYAEPA